MDKELELTKKIGNSFLKPLVILKLLFVLMFFSSPFVWIWHSWDLAWKLGLTGLFGCVVISMVYKVVKQSLTEIVDSEIEKQMQKNRKSKFQQKLDEMQEKANHERNA